MTPSSTPGTGSGTSSEAEGARAGAPGEGAPGEGAPGDGAPGEGAGSNGRGDGAGGRGRGDSAAERRAPGSQRRRPVGGAAAWRVRPAATQARPDEERLAPERTRYGRRAILETLAGWVAEARAHPVAMLGVGLILGGWIILRILTPTAAPFQDISTGQCLYVRTGVATSIEGGDQPIGSSALVRASLLLGGAEPAPCDGSHGHEVAARTGFDRSFDDAYPGEAVLLAAARAPCEAAFLAHVGRPIEESSLGLTIVAPDERRWEDGVRDVLCLVHRTDGQFLQSSMLGSGE